MKHKPQRIDTAGPASSLTSNPFSQLSATPPEKLHENAVPQLPPQEPRKDKSGAPFRVERTRKGGYPIFVENRSAGKTVTIVRNLSGNAEALLALLKKHCAAGGKAFEDSVEIQGDHRAKVEAFLREKGL
jgi:translation initiation factor 1